MCCIPLHVECLSSASSEMAKCKRQQCFDFESTWSSVCCYDAVDVEFGSEPVKRPTHSGVDFCQSRLSVLSWLTMVRLLP